MRNLFSLFIFLSFCSQVFSQNVVITGNSAYTTCNASSVLDVYSVAKGFLTPRITTAQRTAITSPVNGLLVYQTDGINGFYYYNGTTATWVLLAASAGTNCSLAGNSGTNSSSNFLGNVGIATTTPAAILDVSGTYKLGTAGTVLTNMIKTSFTLSDPDEMIPISSIAATSALIHARAQMKVYLDSLIIDPKSDDLINEKAIIDRDLSGPNADQKF